MSPSKAHPFPKMVLEITAIMMMLINLSYAVTSNREDFTFEPLFKRSVTQAGVGNHIPSSSTSFSHAAAGGISSTDSASAGGMHDKWPNGQDGKPKIFKRIIKVKEHFMNNHLSFQPNQILVIR